MGKVGKGLGYYSDIGRKTKDLLTKDYTYDQKFTVSTTTESGLTFTTRGAKHRNAFFGDVTTSFKNKNITTELKVDTQSNVRFSCRLKRKNITTDIKVGKEFNVSIFCRQLLLSLSKWWFQNLVDSRIHLFKAALLLSTIF
jgi:hypothetical protein